MFRCHECKQTKQKGRLVTYRTREKVYFARDKTGKVLEGVIEGRGYETAEEHRLCDDCIRSATGDGEIEADLAQAREAFLDVMGTKVGVA